MWLALLSLFPISFNPILLLMGYISSSTSFPQPLTSAEEAIYLEKYEQGDEEARNILVERNLRLVAHIVKKYSNIGRDMDDLISIGTIGLIKGISTFNREKGTRLATYAARCIENAIPPPRKHFFVTIGGIYFFLDTLPNIIISVFSPSQISLSTIILRKDLWVGMSIESILSLKLINISFMISKLVSSA